MAAASVPSAALVLILLVLSAIRVPVQVSATVFAQRRWAGSRVCVGFLAVTSPGRLTLVHFKEVSLLWAVDWLLDRFRTTNNMVGDCYGAAIVERLSRRELAELDRQEKPEPPGIIV